MQRVGVVGVGSVGQACAFALVLRRSCRELALAAGGYEELAGCDVVLVTAGVNEKAGGATDRDDPRGRLVLLEPNADVYRDVVPQVVEAAPDAVIVVVTDPPDPLADLPRTLA